MDGWSNTNSSSIINFMVVAPAMPAVFWSPWSTKLKQHTANYMAQEIEKVIEDIESQTTAKVVAVVTDNAKNMRSATHRKQSPRNVLSALKNLEADNIFVSEVYKWFRWLRYHAAFGVTSPDEEVNTVEEDENSNPNAEGGSAAQNLELLSNTAEAEADEADIESTTPADERLQSGSV
ncbi:hypothetical protein L917_17823 [Phytophthora nicotianae]|uniref:DUF659 domain-containing protein n=1 Tax=Phytophthora nicotianae TaxID=4792 RepID=W2K9X2_PHYNI|nr:hypothetical protein L917_17823 [Phytophthora nicotianae]